MCDLRMATRILTSCCMSGTSNNVEMRWLCWHLCQKCIFIFSFSKYARMSGGGVLHTQPGF